MKFAGHSASTWLKFAARLGQRGVRRAKRTSKRALRIQRPARIVPYRGYGNGSSVVVSGRLLESRAIREPLIGDPWFVNFRHAYRHFTSDVVPECRVTARFRDVELAGASDDDGHFHFRFEGLPGAALAAGWQPIEMASPGPDSEVAARAIGQILIPPDDCSYGVISDMDDTVIQSNVSDFLKIARLTMFKNARTRKPFEGVAAFYRALHAGARGDEANPLFYVSSSAWNLYDLFRVFLEHNDLPSGPILLRDMDAIDERFVVDPGHGHKRRKIEAILAMYPRMRFLLVGDSGQDDPWIYRETVERHPGRILGLYIRDVRSKRRELVGRIVDELNAEGVPTKLVASTTSAARDAADRGWIDPQGLPGIQSDLEADQHAERCTTGY